MDHYRIEQQDERWLIVHPRDAELIWCGSHWGYPDQSGPPLINFPSYAAALNYASKVLGGVEAAPSTR